MSASPKPVDFTVRLRRGQLVNNIRGYDVEISDHRGFVVRTVWTAGSRRDAEQESARVLRELRSKAAERVA